MIRRFLSNSITGFCIALVLAVLVAWGLLLIMWWLR